MANTPVMVNFVSLPNKSFAIVPPFFVNNRVLAANTAETETIPSDSQGRKANMVIISSNGDFYAAYQQIGDGAPPTAAIPAADITDGTGCELNPANRYVDKVAGISLIAPAATILSLAYYLI